jgi:hypothetical protein
MVNAYVGNPYKLVFPLFSNGHLLLNYDDAVTQVETPNDDTNTPTADTITTTRDRSLWSNTGSFTIECIITPYDVNGSAKVGNTEFGVLDSTKTPPYPSDSLSNRASTYESTSILGTSSSTKYTTSPLKMMLFYNRNVKLYLQNTTDNSYNQPAEYKVVAEFKKTGGTVTTIETDTIIKAENKLTGYYDPYGYYEGNRTSLTKLDTSFTVQSTTTQLELGDNSISNLLGLGTELFNDSGASIGTIIAMSGGSPPDTLTMSQSQGVEDDSFSVYYSQKKEALYLDQMYKISFTYLRNAAEIYVNNALQVSEQHVESEVDLHDSDCFIGNKGGSNVATVTHSVSGSFGGGAVGTNVVAATGGTGSGATFSLVVVDNSGVRTLQSVAVANGGDGYNVGDVLTLTLSEATITVTVGTIGSLNQFYGEIYEIAMHSGNSPNVSTTKTLSPSYSNILFYYRFGE